MALFLNKIQVGFIFEDRFVDVQKIYGESIQGRFDGLTDITPLPDSVELDEFPALSVSSKDGKLRLAGTRKRIDFFVENIKISMNEQKSDFALLKDDVFEITKLIHEELVGNKATIKRLAVIHFFDLTSDDGAVNAKTRDFVLKDVFEKIDGNPISSNIRVLKEINDTNFKFNNLLHINGDIGIQNTVRIQRDMNTNHRLSYSTKLTEWENVKYVLDFSYDHLNLDQILSLFK